MKKAIVGFIIGFWLGILFTTACARWTHWLDGLVRKTVVTEHLIGE
jgi:hypothetical protein